MDTGLTVRPTGSGAASHAPSHTRQAVSTDLASSQTVTAAASAANVRNDTGQGRSADPSRMLAIILDAQSREIIDGNMNAPSRRVVRQIPESAARRLKAYTGPARQQASPRDEHADIEV